MIIKSPPLMNENDYQDYIDFYMGFVYLTDFAQEEKEHCEIDWMGD